MLRLLFVGESWLGSCARSLKEALTRQAEVCLDEVNEDLYLPRAHSRWMRAADRILTRARKRQLYSQILSRVEMLAPDVVMTYKGHPIDAAFVRTLRATGCTVVNVYPDCSPHAHGRRHQEAVGAYDLVVSTKPFHPKVWHSIYGYSNPCVFVGQGYDPALHFVPSPITEPSIDVSLVATWRLEYGQIMKALASLLQGRGVSVGIGGSGWQAHRSDYPQDWLFPGELHGRAYVGWLRRGRVCLGLITREAVSAGVRQPGDEDSTRTYELAAAQCFFIHRRTEFVQSLYDETTEVPLFDTPQELAEKILHYLPLAETRHAIAAAAHRRAVPAYSLDTRASEIVEIVKRCRAASHEPSQTQVWPPCR